ncbi:MAG: hypothetical protein U5P41_13135 [Gammaproteobacteria bacterium]|nr:hypothetical protein [Gammaproteobacteria bacterium]
MINNMAPSPALTSVTSCRWMIPLFVILLITPFQAMSQNRDGEYLLSENTYNALSEINELLETERHTEALNKLRSLQQDVQGNEYEQAVVQQTMGYAYNALERFDLAADAFIRAVDSNALPADVSHRLEYFIAQLLAQTRNYDRAIHYLEKWFSEETDPGIDAYRLAAGLYYENGDHAQVIKYARTAISKSDKPDENLYQLLLASYFETKDYNNAADLLENMLQLFPANESYWKQLYSTYQLLNKDKRALAVYELAYRRGFLNKDEKEQLARLYLHLQAPYRAARFLQSEMEKGGLDKTKENLKLLAESYHLARETDKAIEAYGEAANLTGDGELYFRQGQLLFNRQRWTLAQAALQKALELGTLKQRAQAQLLLVLPLQSQQ